MPRTSVPRCYFKESCCAPVMQQMTREMAEGHRIVKRYFYSKKLDVYVTSVRGDEHGDGSKHPQGDAVDYGLPPKFPASSIEPVARELTEELRHANIDWPAGCSKLFDVVPASYGWHVEFDPK